MYSNDFQFPTQDVWTTKIIVYRLPLQRRLLSSTHIEGGYHTPNICNKNGLYPEKHSLRLPVIGFTFEKYVLQDIAQT